MFLPHSDEICHRGTLQSFINFGHRKSLDERVGGGGAECQKFPSKISCLTVLEIFVSEPVSVSLFSGIENVYASGGYVTIFRRISLSRRTEKLCKGTLLWCASENFR